MLFPITIKSGIRLVIVHPHYPKQHLYLPQFLSQSKTAYIRFDGVNLSLADACQQLGEMLFGQSISDLSMIVLDECDRVDNVAFDDLVTDLLASSEMLTIVVLSRQFPTILRNNQHIQAVTQIIPMDSNLGGDVFEVMNRPDSLEVFGFGQGHVFINGKEVTKWHGDLARGWFFFMMDNPVMNRNVIFEEFWSNLTTEKATNVFHVTKGNIHELFGFEIVEFTSGHYRVNYELIDYFDIREFYDLSEAGIETRDELKLTKACQFYKRGFLQDTNMPWMKVRREELEIQYLLCLKVLAEIKEEKGELDAALGLYIRLFSRQRGREDIALRIMDLYRGRNQPCDAVKIYDEIYSFLQADSGVTPDTPLRDLHEKVRKLC